jgi:hypothetical protein
MSTVQEIQAAIPRLSPEELANLKQWLEEFFEDRLELKEEVKAKLEESRAEIASGQYRTRQPKPPSKLNGDWRFPQGRHLGAFRVPVEDWRLLANEVAG